MPKTFYEICSEIFHQTIENGLSSGMSIVSGKLHELANGKEQKIFEISVSFSVPSSQLAGESDAD